MSNTEFAVIKTGGKQYKVTEGDVIKIAKISDDKKVGDSLTFDEVLLKDNGSSTTLGTPTVAGSKVSAELVEIGRAKKVIAVRYKSKSRTFIRRGHRQDFFKVKITKVA
jgi:large subunit ribosomal protein L21